jgi:hypothetical protein
MSCPSSLQGQSHIGKHVSEVGVAAQFCSHHSSPMAGLMLVQLPAVVFFSVKGWLIA